MRSKIVRFSIERSSALKSYAIRGPGVQNGPAKTRQSLPASGSTECWRSIRTPTRFQLSHEYFRQRAGENLLLEMHGPYSHARRKNHVQLGSGLKDSGLRYDTTDGPRTTEITAGAAQASMLGRGLWNTSYDDLLKPEMPSDTHLMRQAVEIAAVIVVRNRQNPQFMLNLVMGRVKPLLHYRCLELATDKTELVFLTRKYR